MLRQHNRNTALIEMARHIRKMRPDEADEISQLGIRSKAYWGYTLSHDMNMKYQLNLHNP